MGEFQKGKVYFRVKYADVTMRYPQIDSFVYVGKNLSDEDSEDTWYFQFADSFTKSGSAVENPGDDLKVCCITSRDIGDMLDLNELTAELQASESRHQSGDITK